MNTAWEFLKSVGAIIVLGLSFLVGQGPKE